MSDASTDPATRDDLRVGGTVLPITRWGTPVMHARTRPVDRIRRRAAHARPRHVRHDGGRLGRRPGREPGRVCDLAVFVYDCPDDDEVRHVGVSATPGDELPEGKDRNLDSADEGCLSLPGAYEELARPDHAVCRGQDVDGNPGRDPRRRPPGPLPPARDRPPQRHRVRRPAGRTGPARSCTPSTTSWPPATRHDWPVSTSSVHRVRTTRRRGAATRLRVSAAQRGMWC